MKKSIKEEAQRSPVEILETLHTLHRAAVDNDCGTWSQERRQAIADGSIERVRDLDLSLFATIIKAGRIATPTGATKAERA